MRAIMLIAYLLLLPGMGMAAEGAGVTDRTGNAMFLDIAQHFSPTALEDPDSTAESCSVCHAPPPKGAAIEQDPVTEALHELETLVEAWETFDVGVMGLDQWRLRLVVRGTRQVMTELKYSF